MAWGAFVRASGSGAGCGAHWPLCNGEVVPRSPGLETIIELTHRVTSGLDLTLVAALVVFAWRLFPKGHPVRGAAVLSLVFILGEALIGAGLVLFELVAHDDSGPRAFMMGLHLVNTFFLLGALALTGWFASGGARLKVRGQGGVAWTLAGAFGMVALTGASGAIAALGDTLFRATSLAEGMHQDVAMGAHWFIRLRALHPLLACTSAIACLAAASVLSVARPGANVARAARWVRVTVLAQVGAGVLNLVLLAPIAMQLVHLMLADAVWIALVLLGATALASHAADGAATANARKPAPAEAGGLS
jgi:heme A synthase